MVFEVRYVERASRFRTQAWGHRYLLRRAKLVVLSESVVMDLALLSLLLLLLLMILLLLLPLLNLSNINYNFFPSSYYILTL